MLSLPGPNVNDVENVIPEGCYVEQVAYVSRHGSRFPDQGAYNEWVALYNKVRLDFIQVPECTKLKVKIDTSVRTISSYWRPSLSSHLETSPYKPNWADS